MQTLRPIALVLVVLAGCHRPEPTFSARLVPEASFCESGYETVWQAAEDVLRQRQFRLDRTDARTGEMTTFPEISPHFFELWRTELATARDRWESTLAAVRRRVHVQIDRAPDGAGCRIVVIVRKERLSTPERQVTNSAAAVHFLSSSLPTTGTGRPVAEEDTYWIDLGRDTAMEAKLRVAIVREASHRPRPETPDAGDDRAPS